MTDKVLNVQNNENGIEKLLPERSPFSNKGDFGNAMIFGGSKNYVGAPKFSVKSASVLLEKLGRVSMLAGAGRSALCVPDFLANELYSVVNYSAIFPIKSVDGFMVFDDENLDKLNFKNSAVALGMGFSDTNAKPLINYLLKNTNCNFCIDADALKFAPDFDFHHRAVLTPHIGEFSRISGLSIDEIKSNAPLLAKEYAKKFNAVIILKDAVSYISDGIDVFENTTGNVRLAKGGSGDVLAGLVCGFMASGISTLNSARLASFVLGKCADLSAVNEYSHLPSDTIDLIPQAIDFLIAKKN